MTKLVEVALPLEEISAACKADKDKKTGTIKNVHKWFAPMPTPAWRALLFATLVDDPGDAEERGELLDLIKRLVPKHGGAPDAEDLEKARELVMRATGGEPPTVFDPFCGGGSTLIEAQRLGLPCAGSDLNPVPVLITRTLTELMPQVAGRPPLVADPDRLEVGQDGPLGGFLADCRRYAQRVRDLVWDQIGHLYPAPPGGGTVVAWLWARTVTCPNPACRAIAPLVSSFWLSKKPTALSWIEVSGLNPGRPVRFEVSTSGTGPSITKTIVSRTTARCVVCGESIPLTYVRAQGKAGRLGVQLMAVAVEGDHGRRYLSPTADLEPPFLERPDDGPDTPLTGKATVNVGLYGVSKQSDLYMARQLAVLSAFADGVRLVPNWVGHDGGDSVQSRAMASVLGLCVSKMAMSNSMEVRWRLRSVESKAEPAFGSQALPMIWDFAETNPFGGSVGDWLGQLSSTISGLRVLPIPTPPSVTYQSDARVAGGELANGAMIATDPPYFNQIAYADLSDYFYVWLRRALAGIHPDLFKTLATPKSDELIAAPSRHDGDRLAATRYFVEGFTHTFQNLLSRSAPGLPMLIVYAHRQEESNGDGSATSTAWDAMLTAVLHAGLRVVGTWPILGSSTTKQIGQDANALASYMVLVCRPQEAAAKATDRQGFLAALHAELPKAIRKLQEGDISTIDLGPAAIGPGMEVFSRYSKVIDTTGKAMTVGASLGLISQVTGEVLDEFVGDLDNETRWAMGWFRDHGFEPGSFDDAEKQSKATNTSLEGLVKAGVAVGSKGKVRLIPRAELPRSWSPETDSYVTVWEVAQYLVKRLTEDGEEAASSLLRGCRRWAEAARDLAQWLAATALASRPSEALDYDALVTSWSELQRRADRPEPSPAPEAARLPGTAE